MPQHFHDFDLANFWNPEEWARRDCTDVYPTDEMIALVEGQLGYKLPSSYIELMRVQNGGAPNLPEVDGGRFYVSKFFSIGSSQESSLLGFFGSEFWMEEWEYPPIGIYFADTPSAGHDMFCLDYSECGPNGEPRVVNIDQERDYDLTVVAPDFETFIRNLEEDEGS